MPLTFRPLAVAAASLVALSLIGCGQANADKAFGEKVHAYLMEHPEVLVEMSAKLQEKQVAEKTKNAKGAITKYRQALENDPRDFVANPNGSITVVEFFDYRCGYCKLAAPQIVDLIQKNPDVRFVFKDFVIFGHDSEVAARMVLGAKDQGKTIELHKRLMAEKSLDEAGVVRIAQQLGIDVAKARATGVSEATTQHLADTHALAEALAIEGTPAFLVGDQMIPGADMHALNLAIDQARAGKAKKV
ncbi:protein-disulfide isomerase [Caulobacter rhizosphaerae]|jgi:protein-disulfide isomerase|uniref:Protein-disulfide isomerase n=1 Tax=Caulobacter rhizosphaerae TaxID=2010972 RepID=A0ABU1N2M9_9CAUL|nr:DsbA family protein [Caulobacter rhizosphaerae]MDR6532667.1 protein-disulfide isomerase [Caulobacter rhizosphaerae]